MKLRYTYTVMAVCLLLSACDRDEMVTTENVDAKGLFSATASDAPFSVTLNTRAADAPVIWNKEGTMSLSIQEEEWGCPSLPATRSDITGEELVWNMTDPLVSIYITDENGNLKIGNVPYNATEGKIYRKWTSDKRNNQSQGEGLQTVQGKSEFFWDTWDQKSSMPTPANFYGFYPRPSNAPNDTYGLWYRPTSIIERTDADNPTSKTEWYKLGYAFQPYQDENNISLHDVMCCIPESFNEGEEGHHRYGNKSKTGNDNIQMHFEHVFSLLDITVNKGSYTGEGRISEVSIHGNEVYTTGKINIRDLADGEERITPETGNGRIPRYINKVLDSPVETSLIIQPCTVDDDDDLILTCVIDNVAYKCSIRPKNEKIEAGKRYRLNLTLVPGGLTVMRLWAGCTVDVYDESGEKVETCLPGESPVSVSSSARASSSYKFRVEPEDGWKLVNVIVEDVPQEPDAEGFYTLNTGTVKEKNVYYNVIMVPKNEDDWYVTDGLVLHFDGLQNVYSETTQVTGTTTWSDLSGHGNDGQLRAFGDGTSGSGWIDNGGLAFDGIDDLVTFPGKVNETGYTMIFVIGIDDNPRSDSQFWRLNAEGGQYPSFFIEKDNSGQVKQLGIFGHGNDKPLNVDGGTWSPVGEGVMQLTFVYNRNNNKSIEVYIADRLQSLGGGGKCEVRDGAGSVPVASLGGRIEDNSRSLKGRYYSYMLYNRPLTDAEVKHNVNVNEDKRYKGIITYGKYK